MADITRFELIDQTGRVVVRYLKEYESLTMSFQDAGQTLKVFIKDKEELKKCEICGISEAEMKRRIKANDFPCTKCDKFED
jgi:hypothetical protein